MADDEGARPVGAEPRQGVHVLVDDGHLPALGEELERNRGADPAAADDQSFHCIRSVAR